MLQFKNVQASLGILDDHSKGNQSRIFIGTTDAEAEAPILGPPDGKNWLIGKNPDAGKDWRQEEKGTTEDEKVGWHHRLNGREFEQAPGVGDGEGILACCSPWGQKVGHYSATELNWTDDDHVLSVYRSLLFEFLAPKHIAYTYNNFCQDPEITSPVLADVLPGQAGLSLYDH